MKEFQRLLKEHNIQQSMSRKGNCLDNSVMENFFGRLKVEMFYGEKFESVNAFIDKLKEYILLQQRENISQTKRKESGAIPNSIPSKLIRFLSKLLDLHHFAVPFFAIQYEIAAKSFFI